MSVGAGWSVSAKVKDCWGLRSGERQEGSLPQSSEAAALLTP